MMVALGERDRDAAIERWVGTGILRLGLKP
jgi:hypothetical protein